MFIVFHERIESSTAIKMKKMEDALELEVFEIKDGNGGIETPDVEDAGDDDDEEMGGPGSRGRKRRKKKKRKCKRSPSVTVAVTLAEPECDEVDGDPRRDSVGPGSRGTSEGTPGSRRPTSLRESLLSVLGKLVVWRRGAARYRNNGNGGSTQNADYLRGFIPTGEFITFKIFTIKIKLKLPVLICFNYSAVETF